MTSNQLGNLVQMSKWALFEILHTHDLHSPFPNDWSELVFEIQRVFLWCIGLLDYVGHPQPPQLNWARLYCWCRPGPTRVALHPGRVVKEPERQPYIHWTTCYDFEEMRITELCSYTPPRPVRVHDLVDSGSTLTFDCCVTSSLTALSAA